MNTLTFDSPGWLLLIPAFACLAFLRRGLRLNLPLRAAVLVLISLLLANPILQRAQQSLDLWILLDRSHSTEGLVDESLSEWLGILEEAKPSEADRIRIANFGSEVLLQDEGEGSVYSGGRDLTRTGLALQTTLAVADSEKSSRMLLFSDGFSTENVSDLAEKLNAQGIPLDFRLVRDEVADDYRVSRLQLPSRTLMGEPFVISVTCRGFADGPLPLEILRDDESLLSTSVQLVNGVGKIELTDRIARPGAYQYRARITPKEDAHPGNNVMDQWTEISGGPRILLLSNYPNDPLARSLERQGFEVELVIETAKVHLGQLAGARACIFNNVPAHRVPREFQKALSFFVRDQGGGLLMIGGQDSFGSGGYHQSPVDALLPVTMELKSEHRKISTALAIVMDRSGSMGANVGGVTKMDLANNGAINAVNLLGENDYISVIAVDTVPHFFVPLTRLRGQRDRIINDTRKIQASGGGIFVFNGLDAGWEELRKAPSKTKHLILFSDASDTEQPETYEMLIEEMRKQGVTISVIGLGTEHDVHAALLEDIATRGKGRIFFTENAAEVPIIFSQETVSVARSAFLDDEVATQPTGKWVELSPQEPKWLPKVDGYNLSYARPKASVDLVSQDEYLAPLVAHMQVGAGRSMAISFPMGGEYSELARAWDGYGDFAQTFSRWLMGLEMPSGLALKHEVEGTTLSLDLLYDPQEWEQRLIENPPTVRLTEGDFSGGGYEVMWKRIAPGHFTLTHELTEGSVLRGSVLAGQYQLPFGPIMVGSSVEWAFEPEKIEELRHLSASTGGRELLDLTQAWIRPEQVHISDIRVWLAVAILLLVLLDALVTRMGWPLWSRSPKSDRMKLPKVKVATENVVVEKENPEIPSPPKESRRSRFERAKRRR